MTTDHSHGSPDGAAGTHSDCGCGCGGTGGCGGAETTPAGSIRSGRRKFLVGGIGAGAFAATLVSRPAFAACQNLTGLYSPSGSHVNADVCSPSGKTPGFWANHGNCWPSTIKPTDNFSKWFGSFQFDSCTLSLAEVFCPPHGQDNLAFQIAAGLLNAESSNTNGSFGYGSAKAFAASCILAMKALAYEAPSYPDIHNRISLMNKDNSNSSWCPGKGTKVCKSS